MKKYNLTWGQRMQRPFLWLYWKFSIMDDKLPTFDLVLKGMEPHEHKFDILQKIPSSKYYVLVCSHPGCRLLEPIQTKEPLELAARLEWVQAEIELRARCIIQNAEFPDRVENFKKELRYYEGVKAEMLDTIKKYL